MQSPATDVELRLSELQTQIDRLSHALTQVRDAQDHAQPAEAVAQLTERCAAILDQWTATDERHQHAVVELEARLNNWNALEGRLQHESRERLVRLEQSIEHEWQALRQTHEEPVKQLREQAAALSETCVAAANLALRGFERTEARLAALEVDLQGRITQLSRDLQLAVAGLHGLPAARRPALKGTVSPFPLESVMRIHDELRATNENDQQRPSLEGAVVPAQPRKEPLAIDASAEAVERVTARAEARDASDAAARADRTWRLMIAVVAFAVLAAAVFTFRIEQVASRLADATARANVAEQAALANGAASRQLAESRTDAERQVAEARKVAEQAQLVSSVMASPDVVRFNLSGTGAGARANAQVLLSRTRGFVLSAARLPAVQQGSTYQIWLLTEGSPVSVGVFEPDAAGRATIAREIPSNMTRPVTGVTITLEPSGGRLTPAGPTVLTRAQ